jgi:hypothetical protein
MGASWGGVCCPVMDFRERSGSKSSVVQGLGLPAVPLEETKSQDPSAHFPLIAASLEETGGRSSAAKPLLKKQANFQKHLLLNR